MKVDARDCHAAPHGAILVHMIHHARFARRFLPWLTLFPTLFLSACMLQDHLLYYPERLTQAEVAAQFPSLRPWPRAEDLRGYLFASPSSTRGTAVVFHGNAGHAAQRLWYAQELSRLGFRVLLAEYPGYGPRPGQPGEKALLADARDTLRLAREQFGVPLLVIGESLGAAVAAGAVGALPEAVSGLVLITPWDRLASVASHHYPWLPVTLLLRDSYDSVAHLKSFKGPSVVVLAQADSIIPAVIGRKLFDGLTGEKRLVEIPGAEHNDWPRHIDADWWNLLMASLSDPVRSNRP